MIVANVLTMDTSAMGEMTVGITVMKEDAVSRTSSLSKVNPHCYVENQWFA